METRRRLPPKWAESALEFLSSGKTPLYPRDAATVVLVRDGTKGLEVYLLRRQVGMAFAGGMTVFPGGAVDERDAVLADEHWAGPPARAFADVFAADEPGARLLVAAAVRETFEETGVLLAGRSAVDLVDDTSGPEWETARQALLAGTASLTQLLSERGLVLRADLLAPWAHWITPEHEGRRFDTRFFVTELPAGQQTRDVGGEAASVAWMSPSDALDAHAAGKVGLMPPTHLTLWELSALASAAEVRAAAAERQIECITPRVVVEGDAVYLDTSPHAAYPPARPPR